MTVILVLWITGVAACIVLIDSYDRASRTRTRALLERADHPRPVHPLNPSDSEYVYDPASLHDAVLLSLSPSIRGDFLSPSKYHHVVDEPAGSSSVGDASKRLPSSRRTEEDGLEGPSPRR